jgi:hypothetical protein
MSRRQKKQKPALEVKVSFETSRIASECLASAYEQIVPQVCSCTSASKKKTNAKSEPLGQQVGGMHP